MPPQEGQTNICYPKKRRKRRKFAYTADGKLVLVSKNKWKLYFMELVSFLLLWPFRDYFHSFPIFPMLTCCKILHRALYPSFISFNCFYIPIFLTLNNWILLQIPNDETLQSPASFSESKQLEILKAAKSLFSKRTRTLYHWMYPNAAKPQIKAAVSSSWESLGAQEKDFYISQVCFPIDVSKLIAVYLSCI